MATTPYVFGLPLSFVQIFVLVHSTCNILPVINNGKVSCGQYQRFTTCIGVCNDGYIFESKAIVEKRVCDNFDGVWFTNQTFPICTASQNSESCNPLPPPDNGLVKCEKTNSELICTAICNDGYVFESNESVIKRTCDTEDGTWYNVVKLPTCVKKTNNLCQPPKNPLDGQVKCEKTRETLLCTAICNDGFEFASTNQTYVKKVCLLKNGFWIDGSTSFPNCQARTAQNKCTLLPAHEHTLIRCKESHSLMKCTAKCEAGYSFNSRYPVVHRFCNQIDGQWINSNLIPNCTSSCDTSLVSEVSDNQLTSSSQYSEQSSASRSRISPLVSLDGYINSGWRPLSDDLNQFIQVKLNNLSRITAIVTQGLNGDEQNFVSRFRILHSVDGRMFKPYADSTVSDKFLSGNTDSATIHVNRLSCPFSARYVRINPLEWGKHIGLRFDLQGCVEKGVIPETTYGTNISPTVTPGITIPSATKAPAEVCKTPGPPTDGVVYCEGTISELVCTAQCRDGFEFSTKDTLIKKACDKRDGKWITGQIYPPCVPLPTTLPATPVTDKNCIGSQIDCINKPNGDYQTCGACHFYASCSEGYVYVRPCPTNLLFDLRTRRCEFKSDTCYHHTPPFVGK